MTHRIGIIGGDGIGPEVIAEGLKVIAAAGVVVGGAAAVCAARSRRGSGRGTVDRRRNRNFARKIGQTE